MRTSYHRGSMRAKLTTLWHCDLLCGPNESSTVDCCLPTPVSQPDSLPSFLVGRLRDCVECSKHFTLDANRAARHQNIGLPQELRHGTLETGRFLHRQCKHQTSTQCSASCLLHGPPRKMQMEGLRPAVVAADWRERSWKMHASNLTL